MPAERVRRVHFLFGVITVRSNGALCSAARVTASLASSRLKAVMDAWPMSSTPLRTMLMSRALAETRRARKVPVVFEASRSAAG